MTKEKVLNIHQRLQAIQGEVKYVKKDKKISFGKDGGYTVVGHDAVTKIVHDKLVKHGVNVIPSVTNTIQEGNRTTIYITFDWINVDDPDDRFQTLSVGYGIDSQDKGIGKAWSYAQRYTFLKTLHLETGDKDIEEDDIDFESNGHPKTGTAKLEKVLSQPDNEVEAVVQQAFNDELGAHTKELQQVVSNFSAVKRKAKLEQWSKLKFCLPNIKDVSQISNTQAKEILINEGGPR